MKKITEGQVANEVSATGKIVFNKEQVINRNRKGEKVILVKEYTQPEDTIAIEHSVGVITKVGGLTSHASIIAREFGKACIINVSDIEFVKNGIIINDRYFSEGTEVFLNHTNGGVYLK